MTRAGSTYPLPLSAEGIVHVVSLVDRVTGAAQPAARSYDGHPWESISPGLLPVRCGGAFGDDGVLDESHWCEALLPNSSSPGAYRLDTYSAPAPPPIWPHAKAVAKLLTQATFGPTRADLSALLLAAQHNEPSAWRAWIDHQIDDIAPTLHRAYFRKRVSPRTAVTLPSGGVRSTCAAGSRWLRSAFSRVDVGASLHSEPSASSSTFELWTDGELRTVVQPDIFDAAALAAVFGAAPYTLCAVNETLNGDVSLTAPDGTCGAAFANPPVAFDDGAASIATLASGRVRAIVASEASLIAAEAEPAVVILSADVACDDPHSVRFLRAPSPHSADFYR